MGLRTFCTIIPGVGNVKGKERKKGGTKTGKSWNFIMK